MNVSIIHPATGYMTTYTPQDIRNIARGAVKGKGKLTAYWLTCRDGNVTVNAQYLMRDGWAMTAEKELLVNVAI